MKVVITRAENGWILEEERSLEYEEKTYTSQQVFEDEDHESEPYRRASSLANLLWAAFEHSFQSKWSPGISLSVEEKGKEVESTEEDKSAEKWNDFGEPYLIGPEID